MIEKRFLNMSGNVSFYDLGHRHQLNDKKFKVLSELYHMYCFLLNIISLNGIDKEYELNVKEKLSKLPKIKMRILK